MTRAFAFAKARRLAQLKKRAYFVVFESGEYDVVGEYDLETYYNGISETNVWAVEPVTEGEAA